jgi:tetratricopeptide (TPR) repeat protein
LVKDFSKVKRVYIIILVVGVMAIFAFNCASLLITNLAHRPAALLENRPVTALPDCRQPDAGSPGTAELAGPRNYFDYFATGWRQAQQNRCEAANLNLGKAAALEVEGRDSARFSQARVLYSQGRKDQALQIFRELKAARYFYAQALQAKNSGNPQLALALNKVALEIELLPEYMDGLTQLLVEQKQAGEAIGLWEKLARDTPESQAGHWLAAGEAARLRQDWTQAVGAFRKAAGLTAASPELYDLYLRIIRILTVQKDWAAVAENAEKAVSLDPTASSEPYTGAGNAEVELGNYEKAMQWYDRAIRALPEGAWPYIYAGNAAARFGFYAEAERRFEAALKLSPGHFSALLYMALLQHQQGSLDRAISYLEQIEPKECGVLERLAAWYGEAGHPGKAEQYKTAIKTGCQK